VPQQLWLGDNMSKEGIWQDSKGMKDSEIVKKWTKTLHTVEYAMEQLKYQKSALMKKKENMVNSKETKNG
jgi:hypothetical protein